MHVIVDVSAWVLATGLFLAACLYEPDGPRHRRFQLLPIILTCAYTVAALVVEAFAAHMAFSRFYAGIWAGFTYLGWPFIATAIALLAICITACILYPPRNDLPDDIL
jgi:hypothetical protein